MITEAELREHGYRAHGAHSAAHSYAVRLWQKWITREGKRLYALNFYEYAPMPEVILERAFVPEARLYLPLIDQGGFDVTVHDKFESVTGAEAFFEHVYVTLRCIPDPYNQS